MLLLTLFILVALLNYKTPIFIVCVIAAIVEVTNLIPGEPNHQYYFAFSVVYLISGLCALGAIFLKPNPSGVKCVSYATLMCISCFICGTASVQLKNGGDLTLFWDRYENATMLITVLELIILAGMSRYAGNIHNVLNFFVGFFSIRLYNRGY